MLVPSTISTGMPFSSSRLRAEMCAAPLAPPPLRTTATVGRPAVARTVFILACIFLKNTESAAGSTLGATRLNPFWA